MVVTSPVNGADGEGWGICLVRFDMCGRDVISTFKFESLHYMDSI